MSTSDAIYGRLSWRDMSDLVAALLSDPSTRLCAAVRGWSAPVDGKWLMVALLGSLGVEPHWPWLDEDTPKANPADVNQGVAVLRALDRRL